MMKSTGALAFLLAAASSSSSSDAFLFFSATKHYRRQSSSSSLAATPIQGGPINEEIFSTNPPLRIEGNSLKTWSGFQSNRVQVSIKSMGRPVEASVELWQSPSVSDDCFCELTLIHLCASCNYSNFTLIYQTPSVSVSLSLSTFQQNSPSNAKTPQKTLSTPSSNSHRAIPSQLPCTTRKDKSSQWK